MWVEGALGSEAVWFKDRKGDIFAISKGALSIFKYYFPSKCFKQFIIDIDSLYNPVDNSASLLYINQKDIVYFFNSRDLRKSFYFTLYRPKHKDKEERTKKDKNMTLSKMSVTSVNKNS